MKAAIHFLSPVLAIAMAASVLAEPITLKVVGQRVNLRAKADLNAEVVGQVSEDDALTARNIGTDWVEVVPPDRIDLWIHRDFVSDATITGNKVNVRAGAGINYTVVGTLAKGDAITVRGTFGEWLKIAPPPSCSLWVNKDLVKIPLGPAKKAAKPRASEAPRPVPEPAALAIATQAPPAAPAAQGPAVPAAAADLTPLTEPPPDLRLVPLEGQGKMVVMEGIVKPSPFAVGRPSPYRLVRKEGNGYETLCYLRGDRAMLRARQGQYVVVQGHEFWVQGIRQPIVVIESLGEPATN
jgi:SH3-like domain-containing protein